MDRPTLILLVAELGHGVLVTLRTWFRPGVLSKEVLFLRRGEAGVTVG
jgi:hypothetical protein